MFTSTRTFVSQPRGRRGTILPFLAITLVVLIGFLGLAIDIGMIAVAKAQAQQAADLAALTAARSLSGDSTLTGTPPAPYNVNGATTNAQNIMTYNVILGQPVQPVHSLALTYGSYDYSQTTQTFSANYPATAGQPYTAVSATVTTSSLPAAFSTVFGSQFLPNVSATAQAVHRPRDVALVMDLSGSMRMGTCLGYDFYTSSRTCNNPDTLVPTFGHYSSSSAGMIGPSTAQTSGVDNYSISPSNSTVGNSSYTLTFVNNFYQQAAYTTPIIRAFDSYSSTDGGNTWTAPTTQTPQLPPSSYATTPGGDVPLFKSGSTTTYATNISDVVGSTNENILWELDGYAAYAAGLPDTSGSGSVPKVWTQADYSATPFNGYTKGPGYYGKSFFLWPPDPRTDTVASPLSSTTLTGYLNALGVTNTTDQSYLASNWSSFTQATLQSWLTGGTTKGGPYTSSGPFVPGSSNKAPVYYAVCRLFNRAYPAGTSNGHFHADWRLRFFGTNDNTKLFNGSGSLNPPGSSGLCSATTTYNAILAWVVATNDPFPTQLRAGRVRYYSSIPTAITGSWPSYGNTDQRFWVEFMDYTLGYRQTSAGNYKDVSAMIGYGSDFTWGTKSLNSPPAVTPPKYMGYTDNPKRPLLRGWFGPLVMTESLQNYNLACNVNGYFQTQPGDSYEAPTYVCKEAFTAAVNTMEINHPNDWFTVVPFSWPRAGSSGSGRFNNVMCPLGTNYNYARSALVFPMSTINADGTCNNTEITPYDADPATGAVPSANFMDTPRADGDTCFAMALMLCYNQFALTPSSDINLRSYVSSSPITFPTGMAGGLGRKGAQKVIIFETDGIPNCRGNANLSNAGTYNYYSIRYDMNKPTSSEYPSVNATFNGDTTTLNEIYGYVTQLQTTYSSPRNPFRLYAIGFGPVFAGVDANSAETVLQTMQYKAGTQSSASTPLSSYQIATGTDAQVSAKMVTAYTTILQSGVQIALIK